MYRRILVPLDGSPTAAQVLPYVQTLATGLKAGVTLLRVIEPVPEDWAKPAVGLYLDKVVRNLLDTAVDELAKDAEALRRTGLTVACAAHEGRPADKILEEAAKEPETLVAMSTHGRSGVSRWVLGSVASKVLEAGVGPLLLYRSRGEVAPDFNKDLKVVILPLDGSSEAEKALPHAASIAKALGLAVWLVRVAEAQEAQEVKTYLGKVGRLLKEEGVKEVQERCLAGAPGEALVQLADETPGALVALTTHGRTGVSRWVLGSVAQKLVMGSRRPVLVVRP